MGKITLQTLRRLTNRSSIRESVNEPAADSQSTPPVAEVTAIGRADRPAPTPCAPPRRGAVGRRHPHLGRPPRPLLVAERMSTTLNNPRLKETTR